MPFFAVHYTYTSDTEPARNHHRPAHRQWLSTLVDSGDVISSGPYPDGSGALIIASGQDLNAVTAVFDCDPFAMEKLITKRHIIEWNPILGLLS